MNQNSNCPSLADKEMLTDALNSEKFATDNYNVFAYECANVALKNEFMSLLNEEHQIQYDIFEEMNKRGLYPVKPAQQQAVDQVKQKFNSASV